MSLDSAALRAKACLEISEVRPDLPCQQVAIKLPQAPADPVAAGAAQPARIKASAKIIARIFQGPIAEPAKFALAQ